MYKQVGTLCAVLVCSLMMVSAQELDALKNADEVRIYSESGEYDLKGDEVHLKPGTNRIEYGGATMKAREMWFNQKTTAFKARGDVLISLEDGTSWASQAIDGNLDTKELSFGSFGFDGTVWHSGGECGRNEKDGTKYLERSWLTTCDHYPPHYRMSASSITHYPDNTFTAKNIILKLGPVPIFYFPYAWGTTDNSAGLIVKPGYSGKRGAYLRLGRIWKLAEDAGETSTYVDLMSKRGIALGHNTEYTKGNHNTTLDLYGILDSDPPETEDGFNRRFEEEHNRYRAHWYYRYNYSQQSSLRLNIDLMSDIDMLEDWFRRDYRTIRQSKSYLDWTTDAERYAFAITFRPRLNDFYTVVETLPEIRFDLHRQHVFSTPFQYQSSTSLGYYSMKWRNFDRLRQDLLTPDEYNGEVHQDPSDYAAFRWDTVHFLYLPLTLGDIGEFIPRAGIRATYYNASSRAKVSREDLADMIEVDDPDNVYTDLGTRRYDRKGGEVLRLAYEFGAEWKSRLYSDWADWNLDVLGAKGLRHVIQPYVNYTYAPDPSHDCDTLYFFDEIDRLERQHFIRLGVEQLFQTRFDGRVATIARLQNYVDFHFDRGDESDRHPGDFGTRLDIYPDERFMAWAMLLHDMGEGDIQRGEIGFRLGEKESFNMSARYVYRNEHMSRSVYSMGSTLVDLTGESSYLKKYFETADTVQVNVFCPINSKTSFEFEAEYDFDESTLSEHRYILNRRLHCWDVAFGVGWDNGEFEAMVLFRLVAFPKIKVDLNL